MKTVRIEIDTQDWMPVYRSLCDVAGYELHDEEFYISESDQVTLKLDSIWVERETFPPGTIFLILRAASSAAFNLAANLAADLLYDILKGEKKTTRLLIEKTIVEIEEGEIKRIIIEKLETK